jgi:hypothetical protein
LHGVLGGEPPKSFDGRRRRREGLLGGQERNRPSWQTLHRSERVARTYIRHAKLLDDNSAGGLF